MNSPRSLWLLLTASACAPSIADLPLNNTDGAVDTTQNSDSDEPATPGGPIGAPDSAGVRAAHLDATSESAWVHVDLDTHTIVDETAAWTLAFRRSEIMVNGGVSGDGPVEVAWSDLPFDSAAAAPGSGWTTDLADQDLNGVPEYALAWYDYDPSTHVLTPKAGTWFVRTAGGGTIALEMLGYYDAAGTSGMPSFRYKPVVDDGVSVPAEHTLDLDASSATDFVYVSLASASVVTTPADPVADLGWDLAFRRTTIRLNGGVNGGGQGEALTMPDGTLWEDVTAAPQDGWSSDVTPPSPYQDGTALATWYNYDMATHAVSASGRIHVVRDAHQDAWKFTVVSWTNGQVSVRFAALDTP